MLRIRNILKSNSGLALITVMILFMILSILSAAAVFVSMTNARQIITQRERIQAYYLAYSGTEIGYSALLMDEQELLEEFSKFANYEKTETVYCGPDYLGEYNIGINPSPSEIDSLDRIDITMKTSDDKEKIFITSKGTTASGKSVTLAMSFYFEYPTVKKWE